MDRRFDAEEWSELSHSEQLRRCQIMAEQALKLAKVAKPNIAEGYLNLAEQWLRLATEMTRGARPNHHH
jgi:hypothetical protein